MSPARSRRLLLALTASLGVHGLLWLLVEGASRDGRSRRPPPPTPATVEWVEVEVASPPEPVAQAPQPPPPEPSRPPPPRTVEPPPAQEPPRIAERPPAPEPQAPEPPAEPPPSAVPPPPPPDAPQVAMDVPRADVPRADLLPSDMPRADAPTGSRLLMAARAVTAPTGTGGAVATLDAGVPDPRTPPSAQQLVEDLVTESVGRGKVSRGLVHPYFGQLGKALVKAWDADRSVKEHGLQGYFDMGMERGRAYSRIWMERAENYGATGSFAAKDAPEADRRKPTSTVGDPTLQMRRELRQKMREEFRATRRALIRVVQDTQGRLLDVQLVDPSHQPEVDKEAIKDVRAAAEKLPPPPPEAVLGKERITSLWQFELIISISPPVPTFSFEFDEALGFIDTRMPLDRRIYKRVRLVEVR